jgi:UDP-N-acetyl-D-glucosamine dehydrogenase
MIQLKSRIENKESVIGIIGLGYVGLPLLIRFSEEGFKILGFDVDDKKVDMLNTGNSYIKHIESKKIRYAIDLGFRATSDFSKISHVDAILICVPTPLKEGNQPDLSYIRATLQTILPHLSENQLLVLESTTYPGTTEEEIIPMIENAGFKVGKNYFIGYSPEREDPGNPIFNTQSIPKIVSGYSERCLQLTEVLYAKIIKKTVSVSSLRVAEMTKILENIHRAVNIGLVNELKMVADKMDIDIYEVINAAATKPFGFTPYYPGPGLGGHCIPIDPFYLTWKAKQYGVETRIIELAGEVNTRMPRWVIDKAREGLKKQGKKLEDSKVLLLGLAYKKNVDDYRESPTLELIRILKNIGASVDYHDFYIPKLNKTRKYNYEMDSVNLDTISDYDLVLIATDHDDYDYDMLLREAHLIVDTRGRFNNKHEKIVRA